jgi:hypothetical protein
MLLLLVQVMAEALLEFWQQHYRPHTGTASCHHLSLSPAIVTKIFFFSNCIFCPSRILFLSNAMIDMKKRSLWWNRSRSPTSMLNK